EEVTHYIDVSCSLQSLSQGENSLDRIHMANKKLNYSSLVEENADTAYSI
ncbi:hypothetical protein KI387_024484, partial [Taxus chinensis]